MTKSWLTDLLDVLLCRRVATVGVAGMYVTMAHFFLTDSDNDTYLSMMVLIAGMCFIYIMMQVEQHLVTTLLKEEQTLSLKFMKLSVEKMTMIVESREMIIKLLKDIKRLKKLVGEDERP